jgi:Domain of unknown function (DUF1330)
VSLGFHVTAQLKKYACIHGVHAGEDARREGVRNLQAKKSYCNGGASDQKDVLYGNYEVLEGADVQGVVILEFPTVADANAYYDSPAYREAREQRSKAADYRVLIVEGVQHT